MDVDDLRHRFAYHQPTSEAIKDDHHEIRAKCLELALHINGIMPDCREKSQAIARLEEAGFWANAGVARVVNYLD